MYRTLRARFLDHRRGRDAVPANESRRTSTARFTSGDFQEMEDTQEGRKKGRVGVAAGHSRREFYV